MFLSIIVKDLDLNTEVNILKQLNIMLDDAEGVVSFWGTRKIRYHTEHLSLNEIAVKVTDIGERCLESGLDEIRREQWIHVTEKISTFYGKTDEAVGNKNFTTRFLVSLREFPLIPFLPHYPLRFFYEFEDIEDLFCAYSKEAYTELEKTVGKVKKGSSFGPSKRKSVEKEAIFKKAKMDQLSLSS